LTKKIAKNGNKTKRREPKKGSNLSLQKAVIGRNNCQGKKTIPFRPSKRQKNRPQLTQVGAGRAPRKVCTEQKVETIKTRVLWENNKTKGGMQRDTTYALWKERRKTFYGNLNGVGQWLGFGKVTRTLVQNGRSSKTGVGPTLTKARSMETKAGYQESRGDSEEKVVRERNNSFPYWVTTAPIINGEGSEDKAKKLEIANRICKYKQKTQKHR